MALRLPSTLSPSKVSSFGDCALAFRYSAIDQLPEAPSRAAVRGTLVHRALEHLLGREPAARTRDAAREDLERAFGEVRTEPEYVGLELDDADEAAFVDEADRLVDRYFTVEDPTSIDPVGLELMLEAQVDGIRVRGIIDRLERDDEGRLVVTDYKTGRSPGVTHQQGRLGGVTFYALLCEEHFGELPSQVKLLYLGDGLTISTEPSAQAIRGLRAKLRALWQAIERACEREDFRPRPGPLCSWCSFHAYCPAQGGDPALAAEVVAAREAAAPADDAAPDALDASAGEVVVDLRPAAERA